MGISLRVAPRSTNYSKVLGLMAPIQPSVMGNKRRALGYGKSRKEARDKEKDEWIKGIQRRRIGLSNTRLAKRKDRRAAG